MKDSVQICSVAAVVGMLACAGSPAANRYVDPASPTPTPPYTNWARAAHTIQPALSVCVAGDVVTVATGHYDMAAELVIPGRVTLRSVSGAERTTIDGQGAARCVRMSEPGAVLVGFTLSEGRTTNRGAGVYCVGGAVSNCVIIRNIATGNEPVGGGVYLDGGRIVGCVVSSNTVLSTNAVVTEAVAMGGGIYCEDAAGTAIERCSLTDNAVSGYYTYGGGICAAGAAIDFCEISGNLCSGAYESFGGGIRAEGGRVRNCLVVSNSVRNDSGFADAKSGGGGISFSTCTGTVESCTVSRNSAYCDGIVGSATGGGMMGGGLALNSIVYGNSVACGYVAAGAEYVLDGSTPAVFSNCCSIPAAPGTGNIAADPQFVDEDCRLRAASPCIEAGTNHAWMSACADLDGNWRLAGAVVDMGAFEYDSGPTNRYRLSWTVSGDGSVNATNGWYLRGSVAQVAATAVRHNHFTGWSGNTNGCTISTNVIKVPVSTNRSIGANFAVDTYKVVVKSAYGGTSLPVGTNRLAYGSSVTLMVTNSPIAKGVSTQYFCKGWSGAGSAPAAGIGTNTGAFDLTGDSTITWKWSTNYLLIVTKTGAGTGVVTYATGWYEKGTNLQMLGRAATGSYLKSWGGDTNGCTAISNRLDVPMTRPRSITAEFAVGYYSYLAPIAPTGRLVNPSPRFRWLPETGSTWYYLWINRNGETYLQKWVQNATNWNTGSTNWVSGSYTWWVRAWKPSDYTTPWSGPVTFNIDPYVPGVVTQLAPSGSIAITNRPLFVWRADSTGHSYQYYLWINRNDNPYMKGWVPAVTSCVTGTVLPFGTYKWWVRGWSADGTGPWSTGMTFTLGVTTPLAPTGTLTGITRPQFRWTATPGANWYFLQVNKASQVYLKQWVSGAGTTNWTPAANMPQANYQWWIRPWQTNVGNGYWSPARSFSLQ